MQTINMFAGQILTKDNKRKVHKFSYFTDAVRSNHFCHYQHPIHRNISKYQITNHQFSLYVCFMPFIYLFVFVQPTTQFGIKQRKTANAYIWEAATHKCLVYDEHLLKGLSNPKKQTVWTVVNKKKSLHSLWWR